MSTRYYRISYPEALAAWDAYEQASDAVDDSCKAFAAQHPGASPVYSFSVHGQAFHGLRFDPPKVSPLWTVAQSKDGMVQRPRSALPKSFKGDRPAALQELKALKDAWAAAVPTRGRGGFASRDVLWAALGTDWGSLLFNGITWHRQGDAIYVATPAKLDPRAVEITGSEFDAAKRGAA